MAVKAPKKAHGAAPHQPKKFEFRRGFSSPVKPDILGARMDWLRAQLGREPTGNDVLEDARPIGSPLHEHFDWSDLSAAEAFRLIQAKQLVAALRVVVIMVDRTYTKPAFYASRTEVDPGRPSVYVTSDVAVDPYHRSKTLANIIRQITGMAARHRDMGFEELEPLYDVLDQLNDAYCQ